MNQENMILNHVERCIALSQEVIQLAIGVRVKLATGHGDVGNDTHHSEWRS